MHIPGETRGLEPNGSPLPDCLVPGCQLPSVHQSVCCLRYRLPLFARCLERRKYCIEQCEGEEGRKKLELL